MSHDEYDAFDAEFQNFTLSRMRPSIDGVIERKNRLFWRSMAIGLAASLFSAGLIWLLIQPYRELFGLVNFSLKLFIFFPSISLGIVVGSLSHLFFLKRMVDKLRQSLLADLAVFIDPRLAIGFGAAFDWKYAPGDGLPNGLGRASFGKEVFIGVMKGAEVRFSGLRLPPAKGKAAAPDSARIGVIAQARFSAAPTGFELGQELLAKLNSERERRGIEFSQRLEQNVLNLVLLRPAGADQASGPLDHLDLEQYRAFCLDARLCLDLVGELVK